MQRETEISRWWECRCGGVPVCTRNARKLASARSDVDAAATLRRRNKRVIKCRWRRPPSLVNWVGVVGRDNVDARSSVRCCAGVHLCYCIPVGFTVRPCTPHQRWVTQNTRVPEGTHTVPRKKRCHETGCVTNGNSFQPGRPPGLIYYAMIVSGTNDCQIWRNTVTPATFPMIFSCGRPKANSFIIIAFTVSKNVRWCVGW